MAKLLYAALTSLDGYIEDRDGAFDFAVPDAEVHTYINEVERPVGTHLYGRRMYETMAVWQDYGLGPDATEAEAAYGGLWRELDKVVYSRTLDDVWTARTRLEREFDPDEVRALVDAADGDVGVSGPALAQHAFAAGLVDDVHLFVFPVIVGGGKPGLPQDLTIDLELLHERRFASGVVHLHYRAR
jgi:dihydrofolate reductase